MDNLNECRHKKISQTILHFATEELQQWLTNPDHEVRCYSTTLGVG